MAASPKRCRLDLLCVERGLADSRQRAQRLIAAGQVLVDEQKLCKAGTLVSMVAELRLLAPDTPYVSRAGGKLAALLDAAAISVEGLSALDVGASTGGFTDCLLQRGARHVIALDVGYGQLAWRLRQDPRVSCVERTNARYLCEPTLQAAVKHADAWPLQLVTIDVSFISLRLVLPAIARLVARRTPIAALIKPQFESQADKIGKGGVIVGEARRLAIDGVKGWMSHHGFALRYAIDSPLPGPKGNVEHLVMIESPA